MAHALQERYSKLVDEKLRATLVTKDNLIFNNRYEGDPKAGMVKVPVRDTEVEVKKYDRQNGVDISAGSTTYFNLPIDNDEAVNEMIDGFEAAAVPDSERLAVSRYFSSEVIAASCVGLCMIFYGSYIKRTLRGW